MAEWTLSDLRTHFAEDVDLELKAAVGKDGEGALPRSVFETYSAMANTQGGRILLGVREDAAGSWSVVGIERPEKIKKELWDALSNRQRVSANLLRDADVELLTVVGKVLIAIRVPRASRHERPVYVGPSPLGGTFRRRGEGDYRVDDETVRRMLAEQVEDERDARILPGFGLADLDGETLSAYRQIFKTTRPDHPWTALSDQDFLDRLGAWRRDRSTHEEGLTLAGILMFGRLPAILDAVPNYIVDYQERPEPKAEPRWVDRITTDGTWSGNLFDFYRRVIRKLTESLKVPFKLSGDRRTDDTPVHEALREALVNALIHADYAGRVSVLVVKRPDLFGFRNAGAMRVPPQSALRGGDSDCRNRRLQKMFQLVGLGEQAGSGLPKIVKSWSEQDWRVPLLFEKFDPEQTLLELHMVSLLPDSALDDLDRRFGQRMQTRSKVERLALATASIEGRVTHQRLSQITTDHPHDLTKTLSRLVQQGFLVSEGAGRGTVYYLPGEQPAELELFATRSAPAAAAASAAATGQAGRAPTITSEPVPSRSEALPADSQHLGESSQHSGESSQHLGESSQHLATKFQQIAPGSLEWDALRALAAPVHGRRKVPRERVEATLLSICRDHFLTTGELAALLDRQPATLQNHYLNALVKQGRLTLRFPASPNHPRQAYRAAAKPPDQAGA